LGGNNPKNEPYHDYEKNRIGISEQIHKTCEEYNRTKKGRQSLGNKP
jgi:hypothetical protein